eukprot:2551211-Lingulodinium_polyedra.AAC.1
MQYHEAMIFVSFKKGPWKGAGNYSTLLGVITKMCETQAYDDEMFQFVYPFLARAMNKGKESSQIGTTGHMKDLFEYMPTARILTTAGSIAKRSRWFDLQNNLQEMLMEEPILLLATLLVALQQ